MPSRGFEPPANGLGNRCSIHLSYEGSSRNYNIRRIRMKLRLELLIPKRIDRYVSLWF